MSLCVIVKIVVTIVTWKLPRRARPREDDGGTTFLIARGRVGNNVQPTRRSERLLLCTLEAILGYRSHGALPQPSIFKPRSSSHATNSGHSAITSLHKCSASWQAMPVLVAGLCIGATESCQRAGSYQCLSFMHGIDKRPLQSPRQYRRPEGPRRKTRRGGLKHKKNTLNSAGDDQRMHYTRNCKFATQC